MEETHPRVCHVLILCTTIVLNALISKLSGPVILSVSVRDEKIPMDKDQMSTSHAVFTREKEIGMTHRIILSKGKKTAKFMDDISEDVTTGSMSNF